MPPLAERLWRSVPFVTRYITYLQPNLENVPLVMETSEDEPQLTPNNLFEAMSNGLLIADINEKYALTHLNAIHSQILRGINRKPLTKRVMLKNLEIVLTFIWQRNVRSKFMCSPMDFFLCDAGRVFPCVLEMMEIWLFRQVRNNTPRMLYEFNNIMKSFNRQFLPDMTAVFRKYSLDYGENARGAPHLTQSFYPEFCRLYPLQNVVADFADGITLAITLVVLGYVKPEDIFPKMKGQPRKKEDYSWNLQCVIYTILTKLGDMPLLLKTPAEWCRPPIPCPETLLAQLDFFSQTIELNGHQRQKSQNAKQHEELIAKLQSMSFADKVPLKLDKPRPGTVNPHENYEEDKTARKIDDKKVQNNQPDTTVRGDDDLNKLFNPDPDDSQDDKSLSGSKGFDARLDARLKQQRRVSNTITSPMGQGSNNNNNPALYYPENVESALTQVFQFLGDKVTREDLREALTLTSFARTLTYRFQLTPGEVLQIADSIVKGKTNSGQPISISKLVGLLCTYLRRENKVYDPEKGGITVSANLTELQAVYQEDLRRHYQMHKDYHVIDDQGKAKYLDSINPEKREEWCRQPTSHVESVFVSFTNRFSGATVLCDVYTTVAACDNTYRFLLVIREKKSKEILMKIDAGNLQVVGYKVKIFSHKNIDAMLREDKPTLPSTGVDPTGNPAYLNEILEEELIISCPQSSNNLVALERFLEELRLISHFLPPRESVATLDVL